jgi:hypothetical protein
MNTPSTDEREREVYSTLSTIHSQGTPAIYDSNSTLNLVNLTNELAALAQDIYDLGCGAYHAGPLVRAVNGRASVIAAFCLTELDAQQPGVRRAGISNVQDCAESSMRGGRPLDRLDLDLAPSERIARLIEVAGQLAPYWTLRDTPSPAELQYRNEALSMLAYQVVAALISVNRRYGN